MGLHVHCRIVDGVKQYRIWSTETDTYLTKNLSKEEVAKLLRKDMIKRLNRTIDENIELAEDTGSSSIFEGQHINSDWEQERCTYCSLYHHTFNPPSPNLPFCRMCGETVYYKAHSAPCMPKL